MAPKAPGDQGGPRCCKRSSFEALRKGTVFTREYLEVDLELGYMPCPYSASNNHCQKIVCRFDPKDQ